jgi:D-alanyl-D-alanine carboxypeptidase
MRDTAYEGSERSGKKRIEGYTRRDGKTVVDRPVSMTQPFAAGSLISTVDDLAIWDAAIAAGKLLKAETWKQAFSNSTLSNGSKTGYGYGWQISQLRGEAAIAHGGGINGFRSHAISIPAKRTYVAILTNTAAGQGSPTYIAEKVAAIAIDNPFPEFTAVTLDDKQLDKHIGIYRINETTTRVITRDGNQLFSERSDGRKFALTPSSPITFFVKDSFINLKFEADANGETTHAIVTQSNGEDRNTRISKTPPAAPQAVKLSAAAFDLYLGKYALSPEFIITISREGENFYAQATGQGKAEIFAETENRFFYKVVNAKLQFDKSADGKVSQLILFQGGREMPAKKMP